MARCAPERGRHCQGPSPCLGRHTQPLGRGLPWTGGSSEGRAEGRRGDTKALLLVLTELVYSGALLGSPLWGRQARCPPCFPPCQARLPPQRCWTRLLERHCLVSLSGSPRSDLLWGPFLRLPRGPAGKVGSRWLSDQGLGSLSPGGWRSLGTSLC